MKIFLEFHRQSVLRNSTDNEFTVQKDGITKNKY